MSSSLGGSGGSVRSSFESLRSLDDATLTKLATLLLDKVPQRTGVLEGSGGYRLQSFRGACGVRQGSVQLLVGASTQYGSAWLATHPQCCRQGRVRGARGGDRCWATSTCVLHQRSFLTTTTTTTTITAHTQARSSSRRC